MLNDTPRRGQLHADTQDRLARADAERRAWLDQRIKDATCRYCGRTSSVPYQPAGVCREKRCIARNRKENPT